MKEAYESPEFGVRASLQKYREMKTGGSRDYDKCPTMCRNDVFNRTLNSLSLGVTHSEFL